MFTVCAAIFMSQPFLPLYLEASGVLRGQIGLVQGLGTGLGMLAQPLFGRFSDRLDTRRPFMILAALMAAVACSLFRYAHGALEFTLLNAVLVSGMFYMHAAGGVVVGRISGGSRGGSAYAGYRVWGSVGFVIVALLVGWLVRRSVPEGMAMTRAILDPLYLYGPILYLGVMVSAWLLPDPKAMPAAKPNRAGHGPVGRGSRERLLVPFLVAYAFYQFGLYGATAYLSIFIKVLGANALWITGMFAAGVFGEVAVMTQVGRHADRFGRRPILALAFMVMPLRLLLYIPATGPLWVLLVQVLHGLNFGIMGAIAVVFVNDLALDSHRGVAQARLSVVGGLSTAAGPAVCGLIAQRFGLGVMFAVMSAFGAIGAAVFLLRVGESHPSPEPWAEKSHPLVRPLVRFLTRSC